MTVEWPEICLTVSQIKVVVERSIYEVIVTPEVVIVQKIGTDDVWVWIEVLKRFCLGAGLIQG